MRIYLTAFLLLFTFSFQSCVTAKVESNKLKGYDQKFKRIYIFLNGAKDAKKFNIGLLAGLQKSLNEKSVVSEGYMRDPLSLETTEDIEQKIDNFQPDGVFIIKQTKLSYVNNALTGCTYELSITDSNTKKVIWKGTVISSGQLNVRDSLSMTIKNILKKLESDQLI